MGYVHAEIELSNPKQSTLGQLTTTALVDTGALTLSMSVCSLVLMKRKSVRLPLLMDENL